MAQNQFVKSWLRRLLPVAIVAAAVGLTVMLVSMRPEPESVVQQERVVPVQVVPVSREDVRLVIRSQGTVMPRTETLLVAEVSGVVRSVSDKLIAGGFVREGEVLLTLDDADYQVAVDQAQANLMSARAQLTQEQAQSEQAAREWDMSGRSRDSAPVLALRTPFLREAEARVLFAESELQRAQRQLERTRVRAPYDALVREKIADIGQFLGAGAQVARIFATDYAEVRLPLSTQDLNWLQLPAPGQPFVAPMPQVTLHAGIGDKDHKWPAALVRTEGVVDSSSRMIYVVVRIDDPYQQLRSDTRRQALMAGTFVSADLPGTVLSGVFKIPHSAMHNTDAVLAMDADQRLRLRTVTVIHTDAQWVYARDGLQEGDRLIVSPVQVPIDGMRVSPEAAQ
ncbi:efflux RND transporter periplasmic adaptor subunit [Pseudohongiella spirulinae]|uniref:Efflux transporter, RND family, MFP subunit subfamily protein n=1 Tax=Pseudohongiella spirulinae TaxID=1249552 RepID=A0A0S2KEC1_9GAMM|nr:efflux RND transporter periplasmic adaptor subunit [Pseudohongiella spirulinae]ALO46678.1 Efflux transporter, RND family, MFP subunit subfamily protein [Pseudohongiella spirulinae]